MINWAPEPDAPIEPEFDLEFESDIMTLSRIKDCMSARSAKFLGMDGDQWAEAARCACDDVTLENSYWATLLICDSTYELNRLVGLALVEQVKDILDRASLEQLEAWGMAHIVRWTNGEL